MISNMSVLGEGRWGEGDLILGATGDVIDTSGPMERVFAYGVIEYESIKRNITIHEESTGQIEVQFTLIGDAEKKTGRVIRRWCYSYWQPGDLSPYRRIRVREIPLRTVDRSIAFILCIAPDDEKVWLHETASEVNHLIPHTNFHNELMLHLRIRDPKIVHRPKLLFEMEKEYSDGDLMTAFFRYNTGWKKVDVNQFHFAKPQHARKSWIKKIFT